MTEQQRKWLREFIEQTRQRLSDLEDEVARLDTVKSNKQKRKPKNVTEQEIQVAREVITKINEHARTELRAVTDHNKLTAEGNAIVTRYRAGATSWEMRLIAWHKCQEWRDDENMGSKFCRPSILFRPKHFDTYLDEAALAYAEAEDVPVAVARRGQERKKEQVPIAELVKEIG